jgi:spore germination protein KC
LAIGKKVRRALVFLLVSINVVILGGCWDREEINDIAIVLGIGIDQVKNGNIRLTVEIAVPRVIGSGQMGGTGGDKEETIIRSGTGVTIADAIAQLQERLPRRLFWGHMKIVIFGEQAAKVGIREHLDFLIRHPQTRTRCNVFVGKGSAKSMLELIPPIEQSASEVLREMAESRTLMRKTAKETLQTLNSEAETVLLPMVKVLPPPKGKKEIETIPFIYSTAVFKKDRMIGQIDDYITRGVLWIRDEIKLAHVTARVPGERGNITSRMIRAHTDITPKHEKGRWKIIVNVTSEHDIILNGTKLDLLSERNIQRIETELEKDIKRRMRSALDQLQKDMKVDVFGFADAIHKKYPSRWRHLKKRWNDVFPDLPVELNITVKVRRPGMNFPPQGVPEQEVKE